MLSVIGDFFRDVLDFGKDFIVCFTHTVSMYFILAVLGVEFNAAMVSALSVGSLRLFSSDKYGTYRYMLRTRRHLRLDHKDQGNDSN